MAGRRNSFICWEAIEVIDFVDSSDESQTTYSPQNSPLDLSQRDSPLFPTTSDSPLDLSCSSQDWSPPIDDERDDDDFWCNLTRSAVVPNITVFPSPTSPAPTEVSDWEEESSINPFPSTIPQPKATFQQPHILLVDLTQSSDEESSSVSDSEDEDYVPIGKLPRFE